MNSDIWKLIRAVKRSNCFHRHGHDAACRVSNTKYMIAYACIQIVLSQIPNFHKLSWLSLVAAVMSFAYSSIGLGLAIAKISGEPYTSFHLFLDQSRKKNLIFEVQKGQLREPV